MSRRSVQWQMAEHEAQAQENLAGQFETSHHGQEFNPAAAGCDIDALPNSLSMTSQYYLWRKSRKFPMQDIEEVDEEEPSQEARQARIPQTENESKWDLHVREQRRLSQQLEGLTLHDDEAETIDELIALANARAERTQRPPEPWEREGFCANCDAEEFDQEEQYALYGTHLDKKQEKEPVARRGRRKKTAQKQKQSNSSQYFFNTTTTATGSTSTRPTRLNSSESYTESHRQAKDGCASPQKTMGVKKYDRKITAAATAAADYIKEHGSQRCATRNYSPSASATNFAAATSITPKASLIQQQDPKELTYLRYPKIRLSRDGSSSSDSLIVSPELTTTLSPQTLQITLSSEHTSNSLQAKADNSIEDQPRRKQASQSTLKSKRKYRRCSRNTSSLSNISTSTNDSDGPPPKSQPRYFRSPRASSSSNRKHLHKSSHSGTVTVGTRLRTKSTRRRLSKSDRQTAGEQHAKSTDNSGRCCQSSAPQQPQPQQSDTCQPGCNSCCASGSRRNESTFSPQCNSTMMPRQMPNRSSYPDSSSKSRKQKQCDKPPMPSNCSQCSKDVDVTTYFVPAEVLCGSEQDMNQYTCKDKTPTGNEAMSAIKCRLPPKEWQKILFDNFVRDRYCPGTIQDTVDGVINFNAIMIEMMREKIGTIPKDPGPYEPWSLIEAFSLRIDHERCQVRHYSADGNKNETADIEAHFQRQKPTCLNRAISSLLKAERMHEINSPPPRDLFDMNVNRADVLLPNKTVQLVLLTGSTNPL